MGFGKARDRADSTAGVDRTALAAALASSDPGTAFDPYGLGRTTPTTLASIFSAEATFPTDAKLTTYQAGADGPLFSLPGGELKLAAGYERQDFTQTRNTGTPTEVTNNRKVDSVYAELYVPIFGAGNATPGFEDLTLTAAVRYDDYSDVGGTTNPKFGVNWTPVNGVKLRASYGTSFRAPTFPEIFGNSTNLYVQNYQNPNGAGTVSGFTLGSGPNPDLQPETATTWTAGVDLEPLDGLTVNLTYFDIAYKNTISGLLSNLAVLTYADEYAGTGVILFGQDAYDRIIDVRDNGVGGSGPVLVRPFPGTSTACIDVPNPASCVFVDGRSLNLGRSKMSGIDFNLRYRTYLGDMDTLTFGASGTYITSYQVAFTPGGDFNDLRNFIFNPLTFKARASAAWTHGPFTSRAQLTHIGGYKNDLVLPVEKVNSYTTVDLTFDWDMGESFDLGIDSVETGSRSQESLRYRSALCELASWEQRRGRVRSHRHQSHWAGIRCKPAHEVLRRRRARGVKCRKPVWKSSSRATSSSTNLMPITGFPALPRPCAGQTWRSDISKCRTPIAAAKFPATCRRLARRRKTSPPSPALEFQWSAWRATTSPTAARAGIADTIAGLDVRRLPTQAPGWTSIKRGNRPLSRRAECAWRC